MNLTNIEEVKKLLDRHGFHFSKSLGQNFLVASWVPEDIAESAGLDENTGVLEIGPGIGCLTSELSQRAGKVLSVELDKSLKNVLNETLADCGNVHVHFGDVLKQDLNALVQEHFQGLRPVVCANLPYNVTSPVLTKLISSGLFDSITVMVQREVAKRICAVPNTADYGAFSIFVQWHCDAKLLFDVPAGCFIPQPKVTSSVIRLDRRMAPPAQVKDEQKFFAVVRAAFNQRRKTLVNAISSQLKLDKAQVEEALVVCGFDTRVRGEVLDIPSFAAICDKIY